MLAKHVSERPGSAAEVAWHLRRLDPVATEARPEVGSEGGAPTLLSAWPSQPASTKSQAGSAVAESVVSRRSGRLPVPRDWRGYSPAPSTLLTGVGLGLLGRRAATIQGRDAERDAMWAALRDVASTRRPQTVMLVGEPGVGTSRLGGWLVERVRELGIGEAHTVSSEDGLSGAVERAFGVVALKLDAELPEDATPLDRRVFESRVDPRAAEVSAWWMERASNGLVVVFVDSPDGHAELERLVTDPLFGGPQGGSEAACAMLVVTTGTPDAGLIDELAYIERASVVEVPPLPFDHLRDLAELELGLERRLAIRLAREAGGRPAALVLRVRDLAERGGLEPSNEGLRANGQVPLDAPASPDARFDAGWAQLVHATRSGAIGVAVGAVLGETVDLREWRGTLELLGASDARDVVRPLVRMGWVRRTTEHWQFRSPAIRRRVLETIPEAQRQEMELAAAGALNLLEATPERSARRGLHLFLAGHQKAALRVLGPALADVVRERGYALVEAICEQVFRTVDPTTLPLDLRVELEIPWLSARRDMHSGASIRDELLALVDAVSSPDAQVSPAAEKRVRMLTAEVVALLQEPDLAESILEGTEPDARASRIRSIIAHMRGDLDEARKHNEQAYEQAVDPELRGAIANGLGGIEAMAGNEDAAALWFERAASLVEPRQRGIVHGNLAMLQMMRGQPELAYRSARQAWAMSTTLSLRQQGWTAMVVATCAAAMNDDALVRQARERAIFYARRFSSSTPDHGAQPLLERALQTANGLGRAALVEILQTVGDAQSRSD
jgi:hypothetical protein